ncbi:MAG: ubiquinone biosynthesis regulatory protein kinase UbiB [Candidatus Rickettsiella isopodorum]|jgi:ubiquinone biosynthesis protein|nr:ubiquinone biosynthesis regulatory protein kinase UbiB [Gammaproteobacteria bacterium]MDD4893062.1 ubiquinone biosynthesis regulatory protein kinase UbiB [Candidatus Rickettsiella isopodorum]MDD5161378.1 ubiquinone biosynthesis regulatory protein kinase UbiB [Candidatus Rickettsiella isopodorum]
MKSISRLVRLMQISFILFRYSLDELVFSLHLFRPLRFFVYLNPYRRVNKKMPRGERIRLALEDLGPIFVKFGQALSTRRDFIPIDIADELAKLQDQVPPFPGEEAKSIIEAHIKKPIIEAFSEFNVNPLASASIAQVHAAKLLTTGQEVVVKVLRPGIYKRISRDIDLLYALADLTLRYWRPAKQLRPREIVAEFEACLKNELDLLREGANASQLRRNFSNSDLLYIPEVHWPYTFHKVLVMERIYGISISDIATLKKQGINLKKLAERGVEIFFTQVFRDCFFHADMHPGNIFVSSKNKENPQYLGVDFGIMGSLSPDDQRYLAENLMAFFNRDYRRVAQLHVESGWVAENTRINEFEAAIRTVCEPIFERPLKEISFGQLLLRLFQTARRFNMEVQPQLILLQKTLFNVEGLGRQLYPDLDLWNTAKPFLEHWLRKQVGPRVFFRKIREYAPYWAEKFPEFPDLIYQVMLELRHKKQSKCLHCTKEKEKKQISKRSFWFIGLGIATACIVWTLLDLSAKDVAHVASIYVWILGLGGLGLFLGAMINLRKLN